MDAIVDIEERPVSWLSHYADVPIAYEVRTVLEPVPRRGGLDGVTLVEREVGRPWTKDYDALPGNHPNAWPQRFDTSNWGVLSAHRDGKHVGGAVVVYQTPGLDLLRSPQHVAVLWDLRVLADARRSGIGTALFEAAERWATSRGATWLKVETQNVNVAASRFYVARGCELGGLDRYAYQDLPNETQLMWIKQLPSGSSVKA